MAGFLRLRVWDVEHGMCAMLHHVTPSPGGEIIGRIAMIDSGSTGDWRPSAYLLSIGRTTLDYLIITNADQDHMSDLARLEQAGIAVKVLIRNPSYTGEQFRQIKLEGGPLTADAEWYAAACSKYTAPVSEPFNQYMGGIHAATFWNRYPEFKNTNDLSLAVFIKYGGFSILFPGDLEKPGWKALLENPAFREELSKITVLVASHHGRENGFSSDTFLFCVPRAVVISDKPMEHATQETVPNYRSVTSEAGVVVSTTGKTRHVLTTRRDGWIQFDVFDDGGFKVNTEYRG